MTDRAGKESSQPEEEVLSLFRRGAESANQLLRENGRLRERIAELEKEPRSAHSSAFENQATCDETREKVHGEQGGQDVEPSFAQRLHELEEENRQLAECYVQIEEENAQLVNLYVASSQLHSTLELPQVLSIIKEIVINLVGAEKLAVYALDERTNRLAAVAVEGAELAECPSYEFGSGAVGKAAASGAVAFVPDGDASDPDRPLVCIPLRMRDQVRGVIVIYRMLEQKDSFTPRDHELFTLLGEHAATALLAAQLYLQSRRKLDLFQGLCELLVK